MTIKKPIALVTGASSGIGKSLVKELIKNGWVVLGLARSLEKLLTLQKELGSVFVPIVCDISNINSIHESCEFILQNYCCPSLFFLNAGICGEEAMENCEKFSLKKHQDIMAVNYFGVLAFVEFFEPHCLKKKEGHFLVTSSVNAFFAPPGGSAYGASKAAISKAFLTLSLTYKSTPLRFSSIYVGPTKTKGLVGSLPFSWSSEKMASYIYKFSQGKKTWGCPSWFYGILCQFLNILPQKILVFLLKKIPK